MHALFAHVLKLDIGAAVNIRSIIIYSFGNVNILHTTMHVII